MMETETQIMNGDQKATLKQSGFKRFLSLLGISFGWAFLSALVIGCITAGIWTIIPTELLAWGASKVNLIGYVSHCPYVPVSTSILLGAAVVGVVLMTRMPLRSLIGSVVFLCTLAGTAIGLIRGIDIITFAGMGAGVGIGFVLAIIIGLLQKQGA